MPYRYEDDELRSGPGIGGKELKPRERQPNKHDCDLYPWCDAQGCVGQPETCHRAQELRAELDKFPSKPRVFGKREQIKEKKK